MNDTLLVVARWAIALAVIAAIARISAAFANGFVVAFRSCLPPAAFTRNRITQTAIVAGTCWVVIVSLAIIYYGMILALHLFGMWAGILHAELPTAVAVWGAYAFSIYSVWQDLDNPDETVLLDGYGFLLRQIVGVQFNTALAAHRSKTGCYSFDATERLLFRFVEPIARERGRDPLDVAKSIFDETNSQWLQIPASLRRKSFVDDDIPGLLTLPGIRSVFWPALVAFLCAVVVWWTGWDPMRAGLAAKVVALLANFTFGAMFAGTDWLRLGGLLLFTSIIAGGLRGSETGQTAFLGGIWGYVALSLWSLNSAYETWNSDITLAVASIAKSTVFSTFFFLLEQTIPFLSVIKDYSLTALFGASAMLWITVGVTATYYAVWSPQGRLFYHNELFRPTIFGPYCS